MEEAFCETLRSTHCAMILRQACSTAQQPVINDGVKATMVVNMHVTESNLKLPCPAFFPVLAKAPHIDTFLTRLGS